MAVDIEKIQDSEYMLDILIQMEDILDNLDIYVFRNWFNGELIDGPRVHRHWLEFSLRYNYYEMPDPNGAKRLLKHDILVYYKKIKAPASKREKETDSNEYHDEKENWYWILRIVIPRRLAGQFNSDELDVYDDDVDVDDIEDAQASGIDDESGYENTDSTTEF